MAQALLLVPFCTPPGRLMGILERALARRRIPEWNVSIYVTLRVHSLFIVWGIYLWTVSCR